MVQKSGNLKIKGLMRRRKNRNCTKTFGVHQIPTVSVCVCVCSAVVVGKSEKVDDQVKKQTVSHNMFEMRKVQMSKVFNGMQTWKVY